MSAPLDTLIDDLSADLRPVRRLNPPAVRAAFWLAGLAVVTLVLASVADLPAIATRLRSVPDMWLAVIGSTLTAVLGAIAVFELSLPDRRTTWALLPLPGLSLWLAGSGMGCLRGWGLPDMHPATMPETRDCFGFIVGLSIPLSIAMILLIRRAFPLRPNLTAVIGGLSVAAAAATLLNFFHPYDASVTDLAVHAMAVVVVIGANRLFGGRLLQPKMTVPIR